MFWLIITLEMSGFFPNSFPKAICKKNGCTLQRKKRFRGSHMGKRGFKKSYKFKKHNVCCQSVRQQDTKWSPSSLPPPKSLCYKCHINVKHFFSYDLQPAKASGSDGTFRGEDATTRFIHQPAPTQLLLVTATSQHQSAAEAQHKNKKTCRSPNWCGQKN